MTRKRLSRKRITEVLMQLTPTQLADLARFRRHKKWTAPLMAAHLGVDQSTANRRLRALVRAEVLARQTGGYRETGGRHPDLYHLTRLGAAVLSRYLQLGGSYVEAPSVANPISNAHDLWVLELAIRLGRWDETRHRERMTFEVCERVGGPGEEGRWEPTGEQFALVPDLMLPADDGDVFIEVEQTIRYAHIRDKHRKYYRLDLTYIATRHVLPTVYVVFGDERQERMLMPEHQRLLREREPFEASAAYTNMDAVREKGVASLDDLKDLVKWFSL